VSRDLAAAKASAQRLAPAVARLPGGRSPDRELEPRPRGTDHGVVGDGATREPSTSSRQVRQADDGTRAASGEPGPSALVLALQQAIGNQRVARLIQRQRRPARRGAVDVQVTVSNAQHVMHPHSLRHAAVLVGLHSSEPGSVEASPDLTTEGDQHDHVTRVTISVPVTVTLPEWPEAERLPATARAEWQRFMRALDAHEQGHLRLVRQFFDQRFGRTLLHLTTDQATARFDARIEAWRQANENYDAQTHHGLNTGTEINEDVAGANFDVRTAAGAGSGSGTASPAHR
jgi:Bacterial protein of unknown function (DUF922)